MLLIYMLGLLFFYSTVSLTQVVFSKLHITSNHLITDLSYRILDYDINKIIISLFLSTTPDILIIKDFLEIKRELRKEYSFLIAIKIGSNRRLVLDNF